MNSDVCYTKQDLEEYENKKHIDGFDYYLGRSEFFNKEQYDYLSSFTEEGNDLYTYDVIKMIIYLFPLKEAKEIINGKEINPDLSSNKTFAKILKETKKENMNLLENIFRGLVPLNKPFSSKLLKISPLSNRGIEILKDAFPEETVEKILKKKISNKKITELDTSEKNKPFVELLMLLRRKNAPDGMYDKLTMLYKNNK